MRRCMNKCLNKCMNKCMNSYANSPIRRITLLGASVSGALCLAFIAPPTTTAMPVEQTTSDTSAAPTCSVTHTWTKLRPFDAPPPENEREGELEQLGRLLYASVNIDLDEVTLHDALCALTSDLGLDMMVFEMDPTATDLRAGFNGEQRLSLSLTNVNGRTAIETMLALTAPNCTWQLHNGRIEVGPEKQLARKEARTLRMYPVGDLSIEPQDAPGIGQTPKRTPAETIGEIVRMVTSHCEPQAFYPVATAETETVDGRVAVKTPTLPKSPNSHDGHPTSATVPTARTKLAATRNLDPFCGPVFIEGQWASIRVENNVLHVIAPNFVHRAICGYKEPLAPRAQAPLAPPIGPAK